MLTNDQKDRRLVSCFQSAYVSTIFLQSARGRTLSTELVSISTGTSAKPSFTVVEPVWSTSAESNMCSASAEAVVPVKDFSFDAEPLSH